MSKKNTISIIGAACTGCMACMQSCPQKCISMKPNKEGFLYPAIVESNCIQCGVCLNHCPQNIECITLNDNQTCYAATCSDEKLLRNSTSGGMFAVFASAVLEQNGVVFGASMSKGLVVKHQLITTLAELPGLQGSKYVQSEMGVVFEQTKQLLEEGHTVLFSGTPCQIASIRTYLGKSYSNLYLVDLICHGVPSPALFAKYTQWLSQKKRGDIYEYRFRSKVKSWGLYYYYCYWHKGRKLFEYGAADDDPYYGAFLKGRTYRECCYQCAYAKPERAGDITIGDYWGIEIEHPEFANEKGVSSVIVSTAQGEKLFEMVRNHIQCIPSTIEQIAKHNSNLLAPTKRPTIRDLAYRDIDNAPNVIFNDRCYKITVKQKAVAKIKLYLPTSMKRKIKRAIKGLKGVCGRE